MQKMLKQSCLLKYKLGKVKIHVFKFTEGIQIVGKLYFQNV